MDCRKICRLLYNFLQLVIGIWNQKGYLVKAHVNFHKHIMHLPIWEEIRTFLFPDNGQKVMEL